MKAHTAAAGNVLCIYACKPPALKTQHHPHALHSQPPKQPSPEFNAPVAQERHSAQSRDVFQDSIHSGLQNGNKSSVILYKSF